MGVLPKKLRKKVKARVWSQPVWAGIPALCDLELGALLPSCNMGIMMMPTSNSYSQDGALGTL